MPQSSVAMYVLVVVSVQPETETASPACVTIDVPQPSEVRTEVTSGPGTAGLQEPVRFILPGHVMIGTAISTSLMML